MTVVSTNYGNCREQSTQEDIKYYHPDDDLLVYSRSTSISASAVSCDRCLKASISAGTTKGAVHSRRASSRKPSESFRRCRSSCNADSAAHRALDSCCNRAWSAVTSCSNDFWSFERSREGTMGSAGPGDTPSCRSLRTSDASRAWSAVSCRRTSHKSRVTACSVGLMGRGRKVQEVEEVEEIERAGDIGTEDGWAGAEANVEAVDLGSKSGGVDGVGNDPCGSDDAVVSTLLFSRSVRTAADCLNCCTVCNVVFDIDNFSAFNGLVLDGAACSVGLLSSEERVCDIDGVESGYMRCWRDGNVGDVDSRFAGALGAANRVALYIPAAGVRLGSILILFIKGT